MLAALAWLASYTCLSVISGRQPTGHASVTDPWLLPTGIAIGVLGLLVTRGAGLSARDKLPWRLMAIAGFAMPLGDEMWIAGGGSAGSQLSIIALVGTTGPLLLLGAMALLFRRDRKAASRPRPEVVLDLTTVVLITTLMLWYLVLDPLPPGSSADLLPRYACAAAAILAVAITSRIALQPIVWLSPTAATLLVLGGGAALIGSVATSLGPVTSTAAMVGQVSFGLLRFALIVAAWVQISSS